MKLPWRSRKGRARSQEQAVRMAARGGDYESLAVVESRVVPGVRFTVARMSFDRRVELMRRIRELGRRASFLEAGQSPEDKMDAALARAEIERIYVAWGVRTVSGLVVDGADAGPEALAESAPEELFQEALAAVRAATGLTGEQRKNC